MSPRNMPPPEVSISADVVAGLIASQYPKLAGAEVEETGFGWDNFMFRVGDGHVARFPRREVSAPMVAHEARWLPLLAPLLPLPIPAPVFHGVPDEAFPWTWTIARWIDGVAAARADNIDEMACAMQLGLFLAELHQPAPADAPQNPFRGVPLDEKREPTIRRLKSIATSVDANALEEIWIAACETDVYRGRPLWLHGDLHPNNLVVKHGRLAGVIDFTDLTAGDPACDLMVGWTMFGVRAREILFETYGPVDPSLIRRAKGWAINHGSACVAHGADNPIMNRLGESTLDRVLSD